MSFRAASGGTRPQTGVNRRRCVLSILLLILIILVVLALMGFFGSRGRA